METGRARATDGGQTVRAAGTLLLALVLLGVGLAAPAAGGVGEPVAPVRAAEVGGLEAASAAGVPRGMAQSAPIDAPFAFSLVGVSVPEGAVAQLRTHDGDRWSPWYAAPPAVDEGPDPGSAEAAGGRVASAPLHVGAARGVQVRIAGAAVEDAVVHVVDSAGLSRSLAGRVLDAWRAAWSGTQRPAGAAVDGPAIVSRAEWGADEALVREPPAVARRARNGFLHHTAGGNGYAAADVPGILRGIQRYHVETNGWSDIGYNLLVDRFGTIYEGRGGSAELAVVGAHAGGFNTESFGISLIGDFTSSALPAETVEGLARLLAWKYDVHHVDVLGRSMVTSRGSTRFEEGVGVDLPTLAGHRDVSSTTCPASVYSLLEGLRARAAELQGDVLLDHVAEPRTLRVTGGRSIDGPVRLSTRLRPAGEWELVITSPEGQVVHRDRGQGDVASSTWDPQSATVGEHTYAFSSPGRRTATDTLDLALPVIAEAAAAPSVVRLREAALAEPVRLTAALWPGATWTVTVRDPEGGVVFAQSGTGERIDAVWEGPVESAGTYVATLEAGDATAVELGVEVAERRVERLGDVADRVGAAVELSRAAFVEDGTAERAVLARADVFADALAGGPLAGTGGPVLLTGRDQLDDRVLAELERVLPTGGTVHVLGGEQALSAEVAAALERTWEVRRHAGAERTATAADVASEVLARSGSRRVLVARAGPDEASPWADALAGGAWGAANGVPVLLTDGTRLSAAAADVVARAGVTDAVVLGGQQAVSDAVLAQLPGAVRVAGDDRSQTAARIASQLWGRTAGTQGDLVVLAAGYRPDAWTLALAGTPLAARAGAPLLVTGESELPPATAEYLGSLGYSAEAAARGFVLGRGDDVGESVVEAADALLS